MKATKAILLNVSEVQPYPTSYSWTDLDHENTVTFIVTGTGSGTWTATVNIIPIVGTLDNYAFGESLSMSISNTTPTTTVNINTGLCRYTAYVATLSGTVNIDVFIEG